MIINKEIIIVCSPLSFYTEHDEELFFKWIKKIKCIKEYKGIGKALHLHIKSNAISNNDLLDLFGLFDRYKLNEAEQLRVFMNEQNKS